jgi:hypothetical protein
VQRPTDQNAPDKLVQSTFLWTHPQILLCKCRAIRAFRTGLVQSTSPDPKRKRSRHYPRDERSHRGKTLSSWRWQMVPPPLDAVFASHGDQGKAFSDFELIAFRASTEHLQNCPQFERRKYPYSLPGTRRFGPTSSVPAHSSPLRPARRTRSPSPRLQWRLTSLLASVMTGDSTFVDVPCKFPSPKYSSSERISL